MQFDISSVEIEGKYLKIDTGSRLKSISIAEKINPKKQYFCEIKEKRKKRSLNANAYFWEMCEQLSAVLRIPRTEIYKELIKEIGDNSFTSPVESEQAEKVCKAWNDKGIGWLTENLGDSKIKGYTNICFYFGSSTYDTAQMSRLIDLLLEECKEQGLEILSEREKSLMLEAWE